MSSAPEEPQTKIPIEEARKIYDLPNPMPRPIRSRQLNMMSYTDGEGVKREIWMPRGTSTRACELLIAEDWDELAKYPVRGPDNLSYQEEDAAEAKENQRKAQEEKDKEMKTSTA
ncbi:uncharacterized protein LY89DRAFT_721066 [Mollisia scopiformis]|uniref:Uncharacterized protein n=1 Tax=Mollisia scopiformis TaxID=149040 RepID=A0A194X109_MOLSC|nr:uncharacterized protein LY89DRAFT_721066 [Mollisia scopiformis]KUJ13878.1 hypothetical protein LY89DRAFT_721066 [Mollisia scopiformis]